MPRHARVVVDLEAVSHNVRELISHAPEADLCAVVKADGYGHGAVPVARAALRGGATWLAVAFVEEGARLRDAGISEPILLLSEPPLDDFEEAFELRLTPTIYHRDATEAAERAARRCGGSSARWAVHLKVDTGMHRVGVAPMELRDLAAGVYASEFLVLGGVFTHLATADDPRRPETAEQLERYDAALTLLRDAGIDPGLTHVANSAGAIAHRGAQRDLIRCGIAIYGIAPSLQLEGMVDLRAAMSVTTEVSHTLTVPAGEGVSYGLAHHFEQDTAVAVLPVGYADGIPRNFGLCGGEVLIAGVRRPVRGVVTMDQMMVEVGPVADDTADAAGVAAPVRRGDEAVMIGSQPVATPSPPGAARTADGTGFEPGCITAWEWAQVMHTIPYEVVCGFSARMPREYP